MYRCIALLKEYCPNWNQSTLVLQMNFVNYLFQQFRHFEDNYFFAVSAVEDPVMRSSVIQWIISTSVDFSSSSMNPFEERSYDDLGEHFKLTRKWSESPHPLLLFNKGTSGTITPLWENPLANAKRELLALFCLVRKQPYTYTDTPS